MTFAPFTLAEPQVHGVVKAGSDPLPADNTFDFVMTPSQPVSVLIVDSGTTATRASTCRRRWRSATTPAFKVEIVPAARVTPQMLDKRVGRDPERHDRCRPASPAAR